GSESYTLSYTTLFRSRRIEDVEEPGSASLLDVAVLVQPDEQALEELRPIIAGPPPRLLTQDPDCMCEARKPLITWFLRCTVIARSEEHTSELQSRSDL